jgi:hypothetical protein
MWMISRLICLLLHIPLGRVGNKTKDVATGVAMQGRVLHNNPILVEYVMVLVRENTNMGYTDYPLDHVMLEGLKELGQAINQFILWNWHKIFLDGPISPQRQHVQLSQTLTSSPVAMHLPLLLVNKKLNNCQLRLVNKKLSNCQLLLVNKKLSNYQLLLVNKKLSN